LLECRADHSTGATPGRPQVHQDVNRGALGNL
jgi:hypothetical protein